MKDSQKYRALHAARSAQRFSHGFVVPCATATCQSELEAAREEARIVTEQLGSKVRTTSSRIYHHVVQLRQLEQPDTRMRWRERP